MYYIIYVFYNHIFDATRSVDRFENPGPINENRYVQADLCCPDDKGSRVARLCVTCSDDDLSVCVCAVSYTHLTLPTMAVV